MSFDNKSLHSTVEEKLSRNVRVMFISNSSTHEINSIEELNKLQAIKNSSSQIFMSNHLFISKRNVKDSIC